MQTNFYRKPVKITLPKNDEQPSYAKLKSMYDEMRRTNQY